MPRVVSRWVVCLLVASLCSLAGAASELSVLARVGPWPAVSNLIAYKGRVWFVNAVRYPDHNSADIYSYNPQSGEVRFERTLFSQDVGRPTAS